MGSSQKNKKPSHDASSDNSPKNDEGHHRIEAKAYAFLSLWIFSDFLVIFGHVSVAAWTFYFVLVAGLGLFTNHAIKGWPLRRMIFSWSYAGLCVSLPLLLFLFTRQQEKLKPQFVLELRMADANWFDRVKLTNDFLSYNIDNKVHKVLGCLFVPIQTGQSNVELTFSCESKSEIEAEDIEFAVAFPKSLKCIPDPKWSSSTMNGLVSGDERMGTIVKTDEMDSFIFFAPHPLLPKDTVDLPSIKLGIYPILSTIAVCARAKEFPGMVINFNLLFMTNSVFEKNDFHRPFVLLETNLDEIMDSPISPEMLKELQK